MGENTGGSSVDLTSNKATTDWPSPNTVSGQLLRHYCEQNRVVALFVLFGNAMLAALVYGYVPITPLAVWACVVISLQIAHAILISRLPSLQNHKVEARLQFIAASNVVTSLAHVSIFPIFLSQIPVINASLMMCIFAAFWAGGLGLSMGYIRTYLAYVLPAAVVVLVSLALWSAVDIGLRVVMIVGLSGYVFYLMSIANDVYRLFSETINTRQKLEGLNSQLNGALTEAEEANASKTRFLASASHDLRQPLHALSLFSAALSSRELDDGTRDIAKHVNTAVEALSVQMDALLDISKLDAGLLETSVSAVNVAVLLKRLKEEFVSQAAEKGLDFQSGLPSEAWSITDILLLERVLRNLLTNALKYTDVGSLSMFLETENGRHIITVTDTGRGIPSSEQRRVFDEFYQLHNSERNRDKGLGLGLSIVQRICNLLNIPITLDSAEGAGTSVRVSLPVAPTRQLDVNRSSTTHQAKQKLYGKVMVIDDETEVRVGMKTVLSSFGCEVECVGSTSEALQITAGWRPDLLLADFRLRGDDSGIQAIAEVRSLYKNMPALLISGDTAPERLREAAEAGLDILHKPVSAENLYNRVEQLLRARTAC